MDGELTKHQRHCLKHLRQAEALGLSLTEYARAHGVKVRMLYDAVVHFRRRGMMAKAVKGAQLRKPLPASSARGLEWLPTMPWNECPPSRGMSAHLPWNTQLRA